MKKVLIVLILFLSIDIVGAENKDIITIDQFNTEIDILGGNRYWVQENYKIIMKFGENPSESYFYKLLNNNYTHEYKGKKNIFHLNYEIQNIESEKDFGILSTDNGDRINFGESNKLINEKEEYTLTYIVELNKGSNYDSFIINRNSYETKSTSFSISFPFKVDESNLLFSIDGKKYSSKLEGLKYETADKFSFKGIYNKTLKPNQEFSFIYVNNEENYINNEGIKYVIIAIIIIIISSLGVTFFSRKIKNMK